MSASTDRLVLVIGNKNQSSWSMRPWLLMKEAGVPFEEQVMLFETAGWRDEIVKHSPTGRVPVLRHGELVVWDSLAICEYVADAFPDAKLWPEDRGDRAIARAVSAEMHSGFPNMRHEMSMDVAARFPAEPKSRETDEQVARVLAIWSEQRARTLRRSPTAGPFLFGRFSIADAMFAPVVWRFRSYGVEMTRGCVEAHAYYDMMLNLPTMRAWENDAIAEAATVADLVAKRADATARAAPDPRSAQHCYAVIFSAQRTGGEAEAYEATSKAMVELAAKQPGFIGIESARGKDGFGITVSYWDSLEAIRRWKDVDSHLAAQAKGKKSFYERYEVRVAFVERGYKFPS